jgi:hypothetical protein
MRDGRMTDGENDTTGTPTLVGRPRP